ncbi:MAG: peptidase S1, partial [Chloroflexi bacterium]
MFSRSRDVTNNLTPAACCKIVTGSETTSSNKCFSTVEQARAAVIQIQAEGTFAEPDGVAYNAAGRGSGFIIDESGIAVTNNHVVTGAALVKVWLDGENEPRNARIIATSECSDLAVIDIDGDGFPYLEWFNGNSKVGNEVYVAGFPLGDPEYTLTRGIVSKENADAESNWASVD